MEKLMLMHAVQYNSYGGGPASLKHVEVPLPIPSKDEVLIKLEAASVNPFDWKVQKGMLWPLLPPKFPYIPCTDIAGEVKEIGEDVTMFKPGDKVVGFVSPFVEFENHHRIGERNNCINIIMGGDSIVSHGTHDEDSCLHEDFFFPSPALRDNPGLQDEGKLDNSVNEENEYVFAEAGEESPLPSSADNFDLSERKRLSIYQEILQSYDELKIDSKNLKEAKEKIMSYRPGKWIENAGGLKLCDYVVPETTCLILVGPSGSGKSSLINRISKVFEDDKFAPARAQVSYNSLTGDGTYFLREYMIPRDSNSICLYDTRSLLDHSHENGNNKMMKKWMTNGVRHGELIFRNIDDQRLKKSLMRKSYKKGFSSGKSRKVNFAIYVVNGLSVLNAMENTGALERQYIETIVSTFNSPFLSFKDDKPVLVFTHGDLLSLSDRARVRTYLGDLLGIPPTMQIFDIPDCEDPVTESAIIGMLRYSLEHADRNFPQKKKNKVMDKVDKIALSLCMIFLILGIGIALAQNMFMHRDHAPPQQQAFGRNNVHFRYPKLKIPKKEPKLEWHKIRHIW